MKFPSWCDAEAPRTALATRQDLSWLFERYATEIKRICDVSGAPHELAPGGVNSSKSSGLRADDARDFF
jgi:hypothetical protein